MIFSPDEIRGRTFTLSRRGYDKDEVDRFLQRVATSVDELLQTDEQLRSDLESQTAESGSARPVLASVSSSPAGTDDLAAVGEEVAAVLRTARESSARLIADAETEATRIRSSAEDELTSRRSEVERELTELREAAESEAEATRGETETLRTAAEADAAKTRTTAEAMLSEARTQKVDIVNQARVEAERTSAELVARSEARAEAARTEEQAILYNLTAAHSDITAAIARLDHEPGPTDLGSADRSSEPEVSAPVAALFGLQSPSSEAAGAPPGAAGKASPGEESEDATSEGDPSEADSEGGESPDTASESGEPDIDLTADPGAGAAGDAVTNLTGADDPLAELVKQAVGKAVERAAEQGRSSEE